MIKDGVSGCREYIILLGNIETTKIFLVIFKCIPIGCISIFEVDLYTIKYDVLPIRGITST